MIHVSDIHNPDIGTYEYAVWGVRRRGNNFMFMGLDLAHVTVERSTGSRTLAHRAFDALFAGWSLHAIGGGCVVVPRGTPVIAGNSLSAVVGQLSGAAVHGCKPGTGWPLRSSS